jgi:hypothetical protein
MTTIRAKGTSRHFPHSRCESRISWTRLDESEAQDTQRPRFQKLQARLTYREASPLMKTRCRRARMQRFTLKPRSLCPLSLSAFSLQHLGDLSSTFKRLCETFAAHLLEGRIRSPTSNAVAGCRHGKFHGPSRSAMKAALATLAQRAAAASSSIARFTSPISDRSVICCSAPA